MRDTTARSILRWIHIVFSIPILGYIYSPFEEIPKYAPRVRFVVVPVMLLSGLWMWKGHVLRRLEFEERHKDPMNPSERIDQLIAGTHRLAWQNVRQHPQEHPGGRPGDHRGMEVDGKPGVVSRRNHRGRQRPQR